MLKKEKPKVQINKQSLQSNDLKQSLQSNDLKQSLRSNDLKQSLQSQSDLKDKIKLFKIAIVKSLYYEELTSSMERACIENLLSEGVLKENIKTYSVSGSWELPLMVKKVVQKRIFDGVVVFGGNYQR